MLGGPIEVDSADASDVFSSLLCPSKGKALLRPLFLGKAVNSRHNFVTAI
jgi:hypothetical protein